jgi:uncharacterized membrane-anchored protein
MPPRPGLTGTARVDRNIDRLLRRVCPGDIVVLDVLDLDRITADALVDATSPPSSTRRRRSRAGTRTWAPRCW